MASYPPPYITGAKQSTDAPSSSESISYDYSGLDEIRKRQDEANQLGVGRYQQLYGGDVAGSVSSGQRIRSLLSSLKDIAPVRISSISSSQNMGGGSTEIMGQHDEPKQEQPSRPATNTVVVPQKKKPAAKAPTYGVTERSRTLMAGDPRINPGLS